MLTYQWDFGDGVTLEGREVSHAFMLHCVPLHLAIPLKVSLENPSRASRALSALILSVGFGLTGAGTVMLGVLLPILSQKFGLRDDRSGLLFLLQFFGSSLGAVLTGANRVCSLRTGYALLVAGTLALAFANRAALFPAFFIFGLGLGMAMTATSLLFSDRYGDQRAPQLERLNFCWSSGAAATPILFLPSLHGASLRVLFLLLQAAFLLLLLWTLLREHPYLLPVAISGEESQSSAALGALLPLVVLAACAVGVESSLAGWLTTYSHRASPRAASSGALSTSLFMLGIVLSRLIFSTRLLVLLGRYRVLHAALWTTAAAAGLLIAGHHTPVIDLAAALGGLSIGPLFPLLLSFLLERSPRGWIFAVAGLGSALFPWLTGVLSAYFGSLRYGLAAPCAAAVLMILLSPATSPRIPADTLPARA